MIAAFFCFSNISNFSTIIFAG
ncbi:Protein of unknown function [Bacillus wiedmannii]|nr:Protein of unknown function [Bacillus wiedmannii]